VARIPYRVPEAEDLPARVTGVLAVVYLVFNEGYLSSSAEAAPIRDELTAEAIRLGRILHRLLPDVPEVTGLLALMLLTEARRPVRVAQGELVPLREQDRGGWDRSLIAEGHELVRECLAIDRPGHYQLLAAVNAVHTDAPTADDTDWAQIARLYAQLYSVSPSPIVALNRAVAVAELDGAEVALAEVDRLPEIQPSITTYHLWHATRADLLRRLGRSADSRAAYDAALALTDNEAERAYLIRTRNQLA
jgi:RNA polymerase sigma-70 factor (ECF subfamily)